MEWPTRECGNAASVLACNFRPPCLGAPLRPLVTNIYNDPVQVINITAPRQISICPEYL
jgi:hypothetical protein